MARPSLDKITALSIWETLVTRSSSSQSRLPLVFILLLLHPAGRRVASSSGLPGTRHRQRWVLTGRAASPAGDSPRWFPPPPEKGPTPGPPQTSPPGCLAAATSG